MTLFSQEGRAISPTQYHAGLVGFLQKKKNMVKQSLTWKKFLLPRIPINLDNRKGISMRLWRVVCFDLRFLPESTFSVVLQKLSPISQSTYGGPILYFIHCYKHFTTLLLRNKLPKQILRWLHVSRGGSRGRVQGVRTPPPPEMTCGFLIQLALCKKKNYVVYWCWSRARDECTPL